MTKYYTDAYDTLYMIEDLKPGLVFNRDKKIWEISIACEEASPEMWGCQETTYEEWVIKHI